MAQAAAGLGTTKRLLSWAKSAGSPGFHGSRVYANELKPWLSSHSPPDGIDGGSDRQRKEFEQWRKLKIANDREEGLLQPAADFAEWLTMVMTQARQVIEQKLCNEMPVAASACGSDVGKLREVGQEIFDQVCDAMAAIPAKIDEINGCKTNS